jgi:hypothetical protein
MGRNFHARARLSARTRTRQNLKANQRRKCRTPGERSGKPTTRAGIAFAHLSPSRARPQTLCPALSNVDRQKGSHCPRQVKHHSIIRNARHEKSRLIIREKRKLFIPSTLSARLIWHLKSLGRAFLLKSAPFDSDEIAEYALRGRSAADSPRGIEFMELVRSAGHTSKCRQTRC